MERDGVTHGHNGMGKVSWLKRECTVYESRRCRRERAAACVCARAPVIEAARLLRLTLQVLGESLDGQIK